MQHSNKMNRCENCLDDSNSVFSVLTSREKDIIAEKHLCYFYNKGDFIYKEGDRPSGLLYLTKGKVKIFKEGIGGRDQIVRMAKPLGFIGYRALFADENYSASAVTLEDSDICLIEKESLIKVLKLNSELSLLLMKSMATELGISNTRTVTLTQKHIRGRLAESLFFLIDTYGYEEDGNTLKVYLSREDLANLSNMTTSNAIRTLSTFASEMVIAISGRRIKILDIHKLRRISELG